MAARGGQASGWKRTRHCDVFHSTDPGACDPRLLFSESFGCVNRVCGTSRAYAMDTADKNEPEALAEFVRRAEIG
jgi:hypothetical protein